MAKTCMAVYTFKKYTLQAVINQGIASFFIDCEDKKSEIFCAVADCLDKKMAKKCMRSCGLCDNQDHVHDEDHQEEHEDWHEDDHEH